MLNMYMQNRNTEKLHRAEVKETESERNYNQEDHGPKGALLILKGT